MNKLLLIALCFLAASKLAFCHPHPHNEEIPDHDDQAVEVPESVEDNSDVNVERRAEFKFRWKTVPVKGVRDYYDDEDYEEIGSGWTTVTDEEDYDDYLNAMSDEEYKNYIGTGEVPEDYETEDYTLDKFITPGMEADYVGVYHVIDQDGVVWKVGEDGIVSEVVRHDDVTDEDDVTGDSDVLASSNDKKLLKENF